MAATATLVYHATPVGPVSQAELHTAMAAVALPVRDLLPFGVSLASDTTTNSGPQVLRTIVFNLDANFNTYFPPGTDQAILFVDLYTHILGAALKSRITADMPAIA